MLGVFHDEHPPDVELHPAPDVAVPEIEGGARRNEQQHAVFEVSLHPAVDPGEGFVEIVGDVLVEALVVVVTELALAPCPQGGGGVDRFFARVLVLAFLFPLPLFRHEDRDRDVIGVLAHDAPQAVAVEEFVLAVAKVEHDLGAPRLDLDGLDGELALPARFPAHAFRRGPAGAARGDGDAAGDDEARVEPHAELTDELRVLRAVAGQGLEESAGPGAGDGPEVGGDLLAGHADAVVSYRDRARVAIERDVDLQIAVALVETVVGQGLETELVRGVGGIGDQFPEEDLLVAVKRVDHQIQQLPDLGLEFVRLFHLGCLCFSHHAISRTRRFAGFPGRRYGADRRRFQASGATSRRAAPRFPVR